MIDGKVKISIVRLQPINIVMHANVSDPNIAECYENK